MRKLAVFAMVCALSACNSAEPDGTDAVTQADGNAGAATDGVDPDADAGFEAVAPGNYEVERADGSVDQLTILPGMTWARVFANGQAAGGTLFAQDGKTCFVTEGVEGHQCFEDGEVAADGTMQVTGENGEVATVKPVDAFR